MVKPSAAPAARVRMYRQGLGDCFLVSLPRGPDDYCHILIDCGVVQGTPDAEAVMGRVARDIARTTDGHLDVVVVTHEHWDHVSGFLQARDIFDALTIGQVWLPWTEDPANSMATRFRQERTQALRGLRTLANRRASVDAEASERLRGPLQLFGDASGPQARDAVDYLVCHGQGPRVRYLQPGGTPLELLGGGTTRVYVLGPPREAGQQTENFAPGLALFAAAGGLALTDSHLTAASQAFETRYRLPAGSVKTLPFFREHYQGAKDRWRRIDGDWFGAGEQAALVLDNSMNNSSLALAIELEPDGRVLLFPGDAQLGNWSSWHAYQWQRAAPPAAPVTIADLLRRTILYKVGHHGSHGATPREQGLALMTSSELTALLPVCRETAARLGWDMPFPALLEQLLRQTRGRLLRSDEGLPDRPDETSPGEWSEFSGRVTSEPEGLYLEYRA